MQIILFTSLFSLANETKVSAKRRYKKQVFSTRRHHIPLTSLEWILASFFIYHLESSNFSFWNANIFCRNVFLSQICGIGKVIHVEKLRDERIGKLST